MTQYIGGVRAWKLDLTHAFDPCILRAPGRIAATLSGGDFSTWLVAEGSIIAPDCDVSAP